MKYTNEQLKLAADTVRCLAADAIEKANSGHPGGSLSIADIMAYLYMYKLNVDPKNPEMADRDRFVLSKGHAAPALYGALAERGFIPREDIVTLRKPDSYLQGHPNCRSTPGVDMSTGSLGQGVSVAAGAGPNALACRQKRQPKLVVLRGVFALVVVVENLNARLLLEEVVHRVIGDHLLLGMGMHKEATLSL